MVDITMDNFKKEVLDVPGLVLVDFWAEWCGPCKVLSPILEELETEMNGVKFVKVNVDLVPNLANQFQIQGIPTTILFENGTMKSVSVGYQNKSAMKKFILS